MKLRITCKIKLRIYLFTRSTLLFSAGSLVCQMKINLDNGTAINQMKLCTTNEQTVNIDIANKKLGYELRNNVFPEYYTKTSILLIIYNTVNVNRCRVLIKEFVK